MSKGDFFSYCARYYPKFFNHDRLIAEYDFDVLLIPLRKLLRTKFQKIKLLSSIKLSKIRMGRALKIFPLISPELDL